MSFLNINYFPSEDENEVQYIYINKKCISQFLYFPRKNLIHLHTYSRRFQCFSPSNIKGDCIFDQFFRDKFSNCTLMLYEDFKLFQKHWKGFTFHEIKNILSDISEHENKNLDDLKSTT